MRLAILGGAGCIGSALSRLALDAGHEVVVYDDFSGGSRDNVPAGATVCFADFSLPCTLQRADAVVNLASPIGPAHVRTVPVRTMLSNWGAARAALALGARCGARVMQASTAEVYGSAVVIPTPEAHMGATSPTEPGACYVEAKRAAEALCDAYRVEAQVDACVVRIFNTYGPNCGPQDQRAVPAFIRAALRNEPIVIHGDGQQTRSLCYVDDTARGLLAAIDRHGFFGPVNIGNPAEVSVLDLARTVIALTGSRSRIEFESSPLVGATRRCPDIALARRELGWQPTTPLAEGLRHTIAYIEDELRGRPGNDAGQHQRARRATA